MTTSGPRPAARSATLKTPSHARKKAATPRVVAEEEKAKGADGVVPAADTADAGRRRSLSDLLKQVSEQLLRFLHYCFGTR